jgi:hypothetical protein
MNVITTGALKNDPNTKTVKFFVVWEDNNKRTWDGIAACAYAFICPAIDGERVFWGRGGEKNSQTMLAHMLPQIVNYVAASACHNSAIELVMKTTGSDLYFSNHIWKWMLAEADGKKSIGERYNIWRKALEHKAIGRVELVKAERAEQPILTKLKAIAKDQAKNAFEAQENYTEGLKMTDAGPFNGD